MNHGYPWPVQTTYGTIPQESRTRDIPKTKKIYANMYLVYPWYNLQQCKDIPAISQSTGIYQGYLWYLLEHENLSIGSEFKMAEKSNCNCKRCVRGWMRQLPPTDRRDDRDRASPSCARAAITERCCGGTAPAQWGKSHPAHIRRSVKQRTSSPLRTPVKDFFQSTWKARRSEANRMGGRLAKVLQRERNLVFCCSSILQQEVE